MTLREVIYNAYKYTYLILVIGSIVIYSFNSDSFEEDYKFCSAYYGDPANQYVSMMYWKENNLCCHYALNENNNIIQECQ